MDCAMVALDDTRSCATMRKLYEGVESPGAYVADWNLLGLRVAVGDRACEITLDMITPL